MHHMRIYQTHVEGGFESLMGERRHVITLILGAGRHGRLGLLPRQIRMFGFYRLSLNQLEP